MNTLMFAIIRISSSSLLFIFTIYFGADCAQSQSYNSKKASSPKKEFIEEIHYVRGFPRTVIFYLGKEGEYHPLTKKKFLLFHRSQKIAWSKFIKGKKKISGNIFVSDDPAKIYRETIDYLPHNDYISGFHMGMFDSTVEILATLNERVHLNPINCIDTELPPLPRKEWSNRLEVASCWFLNFYEKEQLQEGYQHYLRKINQLTFRSSHHPSFLLELLFMNTAHAVGGDDLASDSITAIYTSAAPIKNTALAEAELCSLNNRVVIQQTKGILHDKKEDPKRAREFAKMAVENHEQHKERLKLLRETGRLSNDPAEKKRIEEYVVMQERDLALQEPDIKVFMNFAQDGNIQAAQQLLPEKPTAIEMIGLKTELSKAREELVVSGSDFKQVIVSVSENGEVTDRKLTTISDMVNSNGVGNHEEDSSSVKSYDKSISPQNSLELISKDVEVEAAKRGISLSHEDAIVAATKIRDSGLSAVNYTEILGKLPTRTLSSQEENVIKERHRINFGRAQEMIFAKSMLNSAPLDEKQRLELSDKITRISSEMQLEDRRVFEDVEQIPANDVSKNSGEIDSFDQGHLRDGLDTGIKSQASRRISGGDQFKTEDLPSRVSYQSPTPEQVIKKESSEVQEEIPQRERNSRDDYVSKTAKIRKIKPDDKVTSTRTSVPTGYARTIRANPAPVFSPGLASRSIASITSDLEEGKVPAARDYAIGTSKFPEIDNEPEKVKKQLLDGIIHKFGLTRLSKEREKASPDFLELGKVKSGKLIIDLKKMKDYPPRLAVEVLIKHLQNSGMRSHVYFEIAGELIQFSFFMDNDVKGFAPRNKLTKEQKKHFSDELLNLLYNLG